MTRLQVRGTRALLGLSLTVAAMVAGSATSAEAAAAKEGDILAAGTAQVVPNSYIVVFKKGSVARGAVSGKAGELSKRFNGKQGRTFQNAVRGFEVTMREEAARRLAADPSVSYVQHNLVHTVQGSQTPTPSWGLDRIDQHPIPLNNRYTYPSTGSVIKAYIIDTGIRFSHTDFDGRAISGFDAIDGGTAEDQNGHGTHVAGTVGGTTYGVAKGVTLVGVRVLDAYGSGTTATVVAGVDWVTAHHQAGEPAVANMSLGGGIDTTLDNAVSNSIASGISYSVAAGNDYGLAACIKSPARVAAAITVGSTAINDTRSNFSNIGSCVDLFAPGSNITSDWLTHDTAINTISGTSMATPHVTGAAALVLKQYPTYTPQQVRDYLVNHATNGAITSPGNLSPNKLLFVVNFAPVANDYRLTPLPASGTVARGASVATTIATAVTLGVSRPITLSASGLPAGATATFSPAALNTGASSTMTVHTTAATPVGNYTVTVTGTGTSPAVTRSTTYQLAVIGPAGCVASNPSDVTIVDYATVESTVTIWGCAGRAGTGSTVAVNILHTYISDLAVALESPDGSVYALHTNEGGDADNIIKTYTLNLSAETANGTWRLRVTDYVDFDTGLINAWNLNLAGTAGRCQSTNNTNVAIPDLSTVQSTIVITPCKGNASTTSIVEVRIVHTHIGDLVVTLIAPDGSPYVLHNRTGGATDNIDRTYAVDLSSETRNGTWILRVADAAGADVGYINSWTLAL